MENKRSYASNLELNHDKNYSLLNNYGDNQLGEDIYYTEFSDKDVNIDYEKDAYFDNLHQKDKYSYLNKKKSKLKKNKYF